MENDSNILQSKLFIYEIFNSYFLSTLILLTTVFVSVTLNNQ